MKSFEILIQKHQIKWENSLKRHLMQCVILLLILEVHLFLLIIFTHFDLLQDLACRVTSGVFSVW